MNLSRRHAAIKVARLRALAERACANEAAAAIRAADRLVEDFGVSAEDLRAVAGDVVTDGATLIEAVVVWQAILAEAIALDRGVELRGTPIVGGVRFLYRGTEPKRNAATALFARLLRFIEATSVPTHAPVVTSWGGFTVTSFGSFGSFVGPPICRESFRLGIALGLAQQMKDRRDRREKPRPGAMIVRPVDADVRESASADQRVAEAAPSSPASAGASDPVAPEPVADPVYGPEPPPLGFSRFEADRYAVELGQMAAHSAPMEA